ncbi:MAG: PD40 domain-containing protein, partial [Acidobacteriota bacterium]
ESRTRKTILEGGTYGRYSVSGHILYVNNNTLFAASFDPEALELKGMPTPVLEGINMNPEGGAQYSVSLNGTLVYVPGTAEGAKRSLVWFDPQGRETLVSETLKEYRLLRLDPAQRRMALDVFTDGNYDIWVQDLQRDTQTRLTFHESADQNPVWSSDGQYIYFNSNRTGKNGIFRKRADGASEEELLLESADPVFPWSASHDGEYLGYFTQNAGGYDVWVLPLNGEKEPQQLWKSDFGEADLVFSPDDRWLAYDSDESGRWEVYVRPFGSSAGKWQISTDGGEYPRWSADGKRLYYLKAEAVFEVPVTTLGDSFEAGRPVKLLEIQGSRQGDVEISRDGQRFYYVKEQGPAGSSGPNLVRFTFNWFEELEQILQTTPVR